MLLKEKIGIHLDQIKQLKGVENAVLTQRDGNPIQSTGVWFSKDEIFNVCAATSAIFNVGIHLYPDDLRYILIEGNKAKILIAPLNNPLHATLNRILEKQGILNDDHEFFIAITAESDVNLGGIFLQTSECLKKIKTSLLTSGESFKPPLINYDEHKIEEIFKSFNVKEADSLNTNLDSFSLSIPSSTSTELSRILKDLSIAIHDLKYAFISMEGGFLASKIIKCDSMEHKNLDNISAMSYSLFQTANRCSWLLKRMRVKNILIDCNRSFQFIIGLNKAIFSTLISKERQKLGLLRLILPQFSRKFEFLIKETFESREFKILDVKKILSDLIIE
ncbi:MAG: hypothetical protein GF353_21695 [Candidatus Lokiarchaeota archaeon]|nr:hypothetical protein [Candidatus Lokiarchaeota archaeon]